MVRSPARAARARVALGLREALLSGRALTYGELAGELGCSQRTVRNLLDAAPEALGCSVRRERGPRGVVRVRVVEPDGRETVEQLAQALARTLLRRIFPVAGTSLGARAQPGRAQVVVAVRGAHRYGERQLSALRAWLVAAADRPRVAVRFDYDGTERGERIVWPLGVVVRDLARVYVAGVPEGAASARDVRTYALERLVLPARGAGVERVPPGAAGAPPRGIERAVIEHAVDLPFSLFPAEGRAAVHVRVRFTAEQARHVRGRVWHRRQRERVLRSGELELEFGPADLGEALAWARQWGPSVTVLGDRRLVQALRGGGRRLTPARRRAPRSRSVARAG
ncbi:MAG: WYL domain-containing protein [Polyangiaceae bacterium]|nr:WYL domain-containing protein [Polyangiaceae bacterium]